MYGMLKTMSSRPPAFSVYSAQKLWTDPHLANQMLQLHLSQETALASRPLEAIDRVVSWLDQSIRLNSKAVCDLGCGPGLYSSRFAECGAIVTGLDFSVSSVEYARAHQPLATRSIAYHVFDYLEDPLPKNQDLFTLIYCDLCALSPHQRHLLLQKVHQSLNPKGCFVFDVYSLNAFERVHEHSTYEYNYMDGFWSSRSYFAFHHCFKYPEESVSLDRYTVIEENHIWDVYNWLQYFSRDSIRSSLKQAGFSDVDFTDGFGVDPSDRSTFGVVASA